MTDLYLNVVNMMFNGHTKAAIETRAPRTAMEHRLVLLKEERENLRNERDEIDRERLEKAHHIKILIMVDSIDEKTRELLRLPVLQLSKEEQDILAQDDTLSRKQAYVHREINLIQNYLRQLLIEDKILSL